MKVLVTGAAGFIGSHLVEKLLEAGHDVRAFVRYNSTGRWGWLDGIAKKQEVDVFSGDIRDSDAVHKAIQGCHGVFHLAALIGIPYSYLSPLAYLKTNVEGTYNVLEAAKSHDLEHIVLTSTSETYGSAQYVPIDERHPSVAQSPYAASKIAADQLALSYYRSYGTPVKIARPFNTYGPRQSARAVIPTIITQILTGKRVLQLGNVHPTRDLVYVEDTVAGFLAIQRSDLLVGDVTNIGTNSEISVKELVAVLASLMGTEVEIAEASERTRPNASEVTRLLCDNTKICSQTGWRPVHDLNSGLARTLDFLRANLHLYRPGIFNV